MTSPNLFQREQQVLRYALKSRVQRGERFPLDPNDHVRKWWHTPGVESVSDRRRSIMTAMPWKCVPLLPSPWDERPLLRLNSSKKSPQPKTID